MIDFHTLPFTIHWLPLLLILVAIVLAIWLLRHRKFVQIRALWIVTITFSDDPPSIAGKSTQPPGGSAS